MTAPNPASPATFDAPGRPLHEVHGLATVAAIFSCIGLLIGNLIGLVLAIFACRHMDAAPKRYHGYRLLFTGWFMGFFGLAVYPLFLNQLRHAYASGEYGHALANVLIVMVVLPVIMMAYAWQDRLPEARTIKGYAFLGEGGHGSQMDLPLAIIMAVIGILIIAGVEPLLNDLSRVNRALSGAPFLILAALGPIFRRRGLRVLLLVIIAGYIMHVAVPFQLGETVTLPEPNLD